MKTIELTFTLILIFFFTAVSAQEKQEKKDLKPNAEGIYFEVEVMPEFPGGLAGLQEYLVKNIQYPEQAKKDSITGKVFVQFIIDESGRVGGTKVIRSASPSLDAEAVRVVDSMPVWTPGKQKGEAVKVAFTIPIMFALK
jgi:TonB family protein